MEGERRYIEKHKEKENPEAKVANEDSEYFLGIRRRKKATDKP